MEDRDRDTGRDRDKQKGRVTKRHRDRERDTETLVEQHTEPRREGDTHIRDKEGVTERQTDRNRDKQKPGMETHRQRHMETGGRHTEAEVNRDKEEPTER